MSQADFNIANAGGAAVRAELNDSLQALATLSSGPASPSVTYPYQQWFDTTDNVLKMRNAANNAWFIVEAPTATYRAFYANGAEGMRLNATGLGIGNTNPAYKLDVTGDINATGSIRINGTPIGAIADNSITYAKIQQAGANTIIGRAANTTGDVAEIALAASRLLGRGSTGDIAPITAGTGLNISGTALAVDVGTSASKIVQLDGSARLPAVDGSQLTNIAGSAGNMVLLATATPNNVANVDFLSVMDPALYKKYVLYIDNVRPNGTSSNCLALRFSTNNGSSWISSASLFDNIFRLFTYYTITRQTDNSWCKLNNDATLNSGYRYNSEVELFSFSGGFVYPLVRSISSNSDGTSSANPIATECIITSQVVINAIRVEFQGSPNILSGTIKLFGVEWT
jgi:hypothetical protein